MPAPTTLLSLHPEVITIIASLLTVPELSRSLALCREWRSMLIATPSLWQRLRIDLNARPRTPMKRLVAYSQRLPLDLRVQNISLQHLRPLLAILRNNMPRLRALKLDFRSFFDEDGQLMEDESDYMDDFTAKLNRPAPLLEVLELTRGAENDTTVYLPEKVFAGHALKLSRIVLDWSCWLEGSEALRAVTTFSANPSEWDIADIVDLLPALEHLRFCGAWGVPGQHKNPDIARLLPSDWRALSSLSFALNEFGYRTDVDNALAVIRAGCDNGVRNVAVRVDGAHAEMLRALQDLALRSVAALRITRGGYDFGLEHAGCMAIGVSVEIADAQGRIFSVGDAYHTREPADKGVAGLLGALDLQSSGATLTSLTFCASTLGVMRMHLGTVTLPSLTTLAVYVLPRSQRDSADLFTYRGPGDQHAAPGPGPFLIAPELYTLHLASHPRFPEWSVGWYIGEWREEIVVEEVREVTAASIAEFIRGSLVFDRARLGEIVLDREVVLCEGLHGEAADDLRVLTDVLQYAD